jgi:hypothetical protein
MNVFLDFEASSLSARGYPIEVAWVFEDGRSEAYLIKPALEWVDWDPSAEAIHRISRSLLVAEGRAHDYVAHRLLSTLSDHTVHASAPSWDGKWLSTLLRAAGLPRHAMRLKDCDELNLQTARDRLAAIVPKGDLDAAAAAIVLQARDAAKLRPVAHRALDDARAEREVWMEVARLAEDETRSRIAGPLRPSL